MVNSDRCLCQNSELTDSFLIKPLNGALMLLVVSPAKNLEFEKSLPVEQYSTPELLNHAQRLVDHCKTLSPADVSSLMKISDKLGILNANRFNDWHQPFSPDNSRQAVFAFNGDVYAGLDAYSLTEEDVNFAQDHMAILSGLYGVLKPLDLMQAYRLEMGTKLVFDGHSNLYQFWGTRITDTLNQWIKDNDHSDVINLASNEYFKSVKPAKLNAKITTPVFKDMKNGQYKVISFFAKKARGAMARFIIENRLSSPEQLQDFQWGGYGYNAYLSKPKQPVFTRDEVV